MDHITKLFWASKGIEDPSVLSMEEKRAFIEELKAFRAGYQLGVRHG